MEPDEPVDKVRARLDELYKDPAIELIRESAGHLPIWIMSGGAASYFLVDYAIKTGKIAPKYPRLARAGITKRVKISLNRIGTVCLGLFAGLQAGLIKLSVQYLRIDPKREKTKEVRSLLTELSRRRAAGGACPKSVLQESSPTNTPKEYALHEQKQKVNKYGDVIE